MKIFRKIRLSSLTKGSIGKYIIYAIGEVILVVIGILIALYLNNKKDVSNREVKQRNHLTLMKEELENNLLIIDKEHDDLSKIIVNIKDLLNLSSLRKSRENISETSLSGLLFLPLTRGIEIDYENGAFNEFIASSTLKDIKNDTLRSLLRSWNRKLETLRLQEDVVHKSLDKSNDYIEVNASLKTVFDNINLSKAYLEINNSSTTRSNKHILDSRQFENILIQYLGVATQLHKRTYPNFKTDIDALIELIEKELIK
ncbi:hypothetical protein MBM09_13090 [Flaviramulus sp. BrNp1-15]|uniref:hypothetical protein n=1 Tax=Flaviramulus sp. BrNp1-15 TaxID=2916754 RepID=UPI001EE956C4|nr:hypothetical protein [Flaviramulus sp. BrNp1-15]ULC58842.1 hypothetical protein MBM09_13090 [Flaviramulus sp. BrNp1-15]